MHRITFKATTGDLVFADSETKPPESADIRHAAKNNRYLVLTTDDEISYDLGLVFNDEVEPVKGCKFEPIGGYYGISIPSGKLLAASADNWSRGEPEHSIDVEAGEYMAQVHTQEIEYLDYRTHLVSSVGENAVHFWERINRLGVYAWIPTLIILVSLLTTFGRSNWYWGIFIVVASWLPYYTLKRAAKYKLTESAQQQTDQGIPNQVLTLKKLPSGQHVPGGYFYVT